MNILIYGHKGVGKTIFNLTLCYAIKNLSYRSYRYIKDEVIGTFYTPLVQKLEINGGTSFERDVQGTENNNTHLDAEYTYANYKINIKNPEIMGEDVFKNRDRMRAAIKNSNSIIFLIDCTDIDNSGRLQGTSIEDMDLLAQNIADKDLVVVFTKVDRYHELDKVGADKLRIFFNSAVLKLKEQFKNLKETDFYYTSCKRFWDTRKINSDFLFSSIERGDRKEENVVLPFDNLINRHIQRKAEAENNIRLNEERIRNENIQKLRVQDTQKREKLFAETVNSINKRNFS